MLKTKDFIIMDLIDSYQHKGLRNKLVQELRAKGIHDDQVLSAIGRVPRHTFMESGFINFAYKDQAFPIGNGQTISQPFTVAVQTQLLQVEKRQKILEIGTGSGYQAAVLVEMGAKVFSIERFRELYLKSKAHLESLNYSLHLFYGDGYQGKATYGPYDRILITAAAPEIPIALIEQLKPGGRMVLPYGSGDTQVMTLIEKTMDGELLKSTHGAFAFVPMLKGTS